MKKIASLAAGCMAFVAVSASAATFSLVGGTDNVPLPSNWTDLIGGYPNTGSLVTTFSAEQAANGEGVYLSDISGVRYEFLGREARYDNSLSAGLSVIFNTVNSSPGAVAVADNQASGILNFTFRTDSLVSGSIPGSYTNVMGASLQTLAMAVFFESDHSFILMLNDGISDQDYDDMLVRVTSISAIPLPAAFWLFGSGLAGLFGLRKRVKKA